jgi:hypothetical protein
MLPYPAHPPRYGVQSLADLQNISKLSNLRLFRDLHPKFLPNASGCADPPHSATSPNPRGGPAPRQNLPNRRHSLTVITPAQSSRHYSHRHPSTVIFLLQSSHKHSHHAITLIATHPQSYSYYSHHPMTVTNHASKAKIISKIYFHQFNPAS